MEQTAENALLDWDVFVTPGIPIVTPDLPPGVREAYFQAMASTLICGMRDAVLVDTFMTVKQANALADWVAAKGKNLTTVYDVHLYLAESNVQTRQEWISALDKMESLNPRAVVATHKRPENDDNPRIIEKTRQYIRDFDQLAGTTTTAQELYDKMLELYPNRVNPGGRSGVRHAQSSHEPDEFLKERPDGNEDRNRAVQRHDFQAI